MKNFTRKCARTLVVAAASLSSLSPNLFADPTPAHDRLTKEVRHELLMLPNFGVFDNLTYSVNDNTVVLQGQVTRPTLRAEAENVVKRLEGVSQVNNIIEVLPLSNHDDDIRLTAFRAIYGDPSLISRYGYRAQLPIHIIVRNGNLILEGVVANDTDRNLINIRANSVPGVFSVTNNLRTDAQTNS